MMKHKVCDQCGMKMVALDHGRSKEGTCWPNPHVIPGWFWWCNCGNEQYAYDYLVVSNYDIWEEVNRDYIVTGP